MYTLEEPAIPTFSSLKEYRYSGGKWVVRIFHHLVTNEAPGLHRADLPLTPTLLPLPLRQVPAEPTTNQDSNLGKVEEDMREKAQKIVRLSKLDRAGESEADNIDGPVTQAEYFKRRPGVCWPRRSSANTSWAPNLTA